MRACLLGGVLVLVTLTASASADVAVDLKAADPVAGLPVISANRLNFLRPYRLLRPKCKKPDIFVESGGIEPHLHGQYSTAQLIGGCEPADTYAGNISSVNASMSDTQCSTAGLRGQLVAKLPATIQVDGMRVDISATTTSAHVTINRFETRAGTWSGGRRMVLGMAPEEVRAWYVVDVGVQRQLVVLLAGKEPDGTIAERWMEIWAGKAPAKATPIDIARTWLLALATREPAALTQLTAVPFERVGFVPASGALAASCPNTRSAKTAGELAGVLACALAEAPTRYLALYNEEEFAKVATVPSELKAHSRLLATLIKAGHTLVVFSTDDERGSVVVALAVKDGKVTAVVELATTR